MVAIVLLCHFHGLTSLVQGCGLLNSATAEDMAESPLSTEAEDVTDILKKMEDIMTQNVEPLDVSEVARRFETVKPDEIQTATSVVSSSNSNSKSRASTPASDEEIKMVDPTKYTSDLDFQYVDFVKRDRPELFPTFRETVSL